jgi:hypothetical protein
MTVKIDRRRMYCCCVKTVEAITSSDITICECVACGVELRVIDGVWVDVDTPHHARGEAYLAFRKITVTQEEYDRVLEAYKEVNKPALSGTLHKRKDNDGNETQAGEAVAGTT